MFRQATARQIPIAVINGRISDKSFSRYKLVRPFIRRVLNDLTIAAMQTERDAGRIRELGLSADQISVSGNLKFDSASIPSNDRFTDGISARFGFGDEPPANRCRKHA